MDSLVDILQSTIRSLSSRAEVDWDIMGSKPNFLDFVKKLIRTDDVEDGLRKALERDGWKHTFAFLHLQSRKPGVPRWSVKVKSDFRRDGKKWTGIREDRGEMDALDRTIAKFFKRYPTLRWAGLGAPGQGYPGYVDTQFGNFETTGDLEVDE
jgi:hypothetical protein